MNVLFFLTPKENVSYLYSDFTARQALQKMKYYHYSAIPVIDREGHYVGTVKEGDFLWTMLDREGGVDWKAAENIKLSELEIHRDNQAVEIDANIEDLMQLAMNQNFIPVVDVRNIFIGIVTRKDIIQYFSAQVFDCDKEKKTQEMTISEAR